MSETFRKIVDLIHRGEVRITAHGYDEIAEDGILTDEVIASVAGAVLVEDYPEYSKGPVLLSYNGIGTAARFMRFGASRKGRCPRPCW